MLLRRPIAARQLSDMSDTSSCGLEAWGWDASLSLGARELLGAGRLVGRVISEDRLGYVLVTSRGELRAVLPGKLRRAAAARTGASRLGKPAVGDFVVVEDRPGRDGVPVLAVVPRRTKLSRKAAGRDAVEQVVGANIDVALLVTSLGFEDGSVDLSPRRLERYRAICVEGGVTPVVVLTKSDLASDPLAARATVEQTIPGVAVHVTSILGGEGSGEGLAQVDAYLRPATTIALLGSSGVGKSTLINRWIPHAHGAGQAVNEVRDDGKGRHTTTGRALFRTPSGAIVMDNPGMRELGLWDAEKGVAATFADLEVVAERCKFSDCEHVAEPGCAIREALERREVDPERVESWRKLRAELAALERLREARVAHPRAREEKRASKAAQRALRARLRDKGR